MKKRVDFFDVAKGIGILLVVSAHIYDSDVFYKLTYSFHMPLFLIISGMLISLTNPQNKPYPKLILSRLKGLMIPYVITEILCVPLFYFRGGYSPSDLRWIISDSVFLYHTLGAATWFLLGLFIAELIYFLILKTNPYRWLTIAICSALYILALVIKTENHIVFILLRSLVMMFYIMVGHQLSAFFSQKHPIAITLALIAVFFAGVFFNPAPVVMVDMSFGNPVLFTIAAVAGSALVISFSQALSNSQNNILSTVKNQCVFLGQQTVIILCSHLIIMRYGVDVLLQAGPRYSFWPATALFLFVMALQYAMIWIKIGFAKLKKTKQKLGETAA